MKVIIISTIMLLWATNSYGIVCHASPTNNDPGVIAPCYAKMLSHFEEIIKRQMAYNYANHLKGNRLSEAKFRHKYYNQMLNELELIQTLKHRLNYPDPRPAVKCVAPSNED